MKPSYRKSWVGNLLMWSHLTLDPSFKVKRQPNFKMLITSGILILYVFYYCFYMFAMFGDTPPARNKVSGISIVYLFGVLCHFQHCTGHIGMGRFVGRGNQFI